MFSLWPAAMLVLLLGRVRAANFSECHERSEGGHGDDVQPSPARTLIQMQLQRWSHRDNLGKVTEIQARDQNTHVVNVVGPNNTSTGSNITRKSPQQHGFIAKAGISAVTWLQMLYVKSKQKIQVMVDEPEKALHDIPLVLKCLLGFLILVCVPMMILVAYLSVTGCSGYMNRFRQCWQQQQRLSPQVGSLSSASNRAFSRSPSTKCATPLSNNGGRDSLLARQEKQDHRPRPILPLQSRDWSREHKNKIQGPCICPELLVPEGKECCLMLPLVFSQDVRPPGRFPIVSPDGEEVFSLQLGSSGRVATQGKRLLTLLSAATEGVVFASCDAVVSGKGEPQKLAINDRDGKHFADMHRLGRDKSALFAPRSGPSATIRYEDQDASRILVTDSNGWLLAVVEMIDDAVQAVRIGAKVDTGLVTIMILSFNQLGPEHEVKS